ncbi:MAG: APC family permease [Clostridia bacterium]|nr:APC family permease [Clostridia bacterium]
MQKVKKQYGVWTGIAMVIGIVIGSGVFIKAGGVLNSAGGDLKISLLAWFIGGLIMITSSFCFAVFATKVTKFNGVVDYVEAATNKKVAYFIAWTLTTLYYPIITSIVAIFAGHYFFRMFGLTYWYGDWQVLLFAFCFITLSVILNYYSPKISAKFQVSATAIKLIPIALIVIVGLLASIIISPDLGIVNAFINNAEVGTANFGAAITTTAFAYEGWVCATSINAELKDSKKNLPKALVFGTLAILIFYILYYASLSAILGNEGVINAGANAPIVVFEKIFGNFGGILFTLFITISCMGTVNGLIISSCRGMYTLSCRGQGICPEKFSKISKNGSTSFWSCVYGYACSIIILAFWALIFNNDWFLAKFGALDELVCAIIYAVYITMYVCIIRKFKDESIFKRFVMPILAIIGSIFFTLCGTGLFTFITTGSTTGLENFGYFLIVFLIFVGPSIFFYRKDAKPLVEDSNASEESKIN